MIFATVGTQLPFDRLLRDLDAWAARNPNVPVVAQTGMHAAHFPHIQTVSHLSQSEFRAHVERAQLIVSHAGMGTILSAAELNKRIILMPRQAALKEHRNDHQRDTAREMAHLSNVSVVEDGDALHAALNRTMLLSCDADMLFRTRPTREIDPLLDTIREFVWMDAKSSMPSVGSFRRKVA